MDDIEYTPPLPSVDLPWKFVERKTQRLASLRRLPLGARLSFSRGRELRCFSGRKQGATFHESRRAAGMLSPPRDKK